MKRVRRKMRQMLAGIVAATLIVTAVPTTAFAAQDSEELLEAAAEASSESSSFDEAGSELDESAAEYSSIPQDIASEEESTAVEADAEDAAAETTGVEDAALENDDEEALSPEDGAASEDSEEPEADAAAIAETSEEAATAEDSSVEEIVAELDEELLVGAGEEKSVSFIDYYRESNIKELCDISYDNGDGEFVPFTENYHYLPAGSTFSFKVAAHEGSAVYGVYEGRKLTPVEGVYSYTVKYDTVFEIRLVNPTYQVKAIDKSGKAVINYMRATEYDNSNTCTYVSGDIEAEPGDITVGYGNILLFKPAISEEYAESYGIKYVTVDGKRANPLTMGEIVKDGDKYTTEGWYYIPYDEYDHEIEIVAQAQTILRVRGYFYGTVSIDGKAVESTKTKDSEGIIWYEYLIPTGSVVEIAIEHNDFYTFTYEDITDNDNPKELPSKDGVCTLTMSKSMDLIVGVNAVPRILIGGRELLSNSVVSIGANEELYLSVYDYDDIDIVSFLAVSGRKEVEGFVTREGDASLAIHASKASSKGITSVVLTIEDIEGNNYKVNFNVAKTLTTLSVKGFKNNTIDQVAGTEKNYAVTLNKGAGYTDLQIEATSADNTHTVNYDPQKKVLTVATYKESDEKTVLSSGNIIIKFKDKNTDEVKGTFTVRSVAPSRIAAPTVKVTGATDIDISLSLGLPAAEKSYKNIFYKIEASASEPCNDVMLEVPPTEYVPAAETVYKLYLAADAEAELGEGAAQKYDIKVSLVQVKDNSNSPSLAGNIQKEGEIKTLKNQSTNSPRYETKLSLIRKTSTVTIRQKNALLATAKFSSTTSYRKLAGAWIIDPDGEKCKNTWIDPDTCDIYWEECDSLLKAGKYTLYVEPVSENGAYTTPATMSFTVKGNIRSINIQPDQGYVYKAKNKAATLKVKATIIQGDYYKASQKAAGKNVRWSVESENADLTKALSLKGTTVTVSKDYVLSANPEDNVFYVIAEATDLDSSYAEWSYGKFEVCNEALVPTRIVYGGVEGVAKNPQAHTSGDFKDDAVVVYDQYGVIIPTGALSYAVTPSLKCRGYLDDAAYFTGRKPGVYTIKVTTTGNSNKSLSMKFAIKDAVLDHYKTTITAFGYDGIDRDITDDNGAVTDPALKDAKLIRVKVSAVTEDNELCKGAVNITAKGAKKVSYQPLESDADYNSSYALFKPTADNFEITISSKDGKANRVYKLTNDCTHTGRLIRDPQGYSFTEDTYVDPVFSFGLSGVTLNPEGSGDTYRLKYSLPESTYAKSAKTEVLEKVLNNLFQSAKMTFSGGTEAKPETITMTSKKGPAGLIPKGSYTFYVTLARRNSEGIYVENLTDPVKMTLKVTAPASPTITLNPKVTMGSAPDSVKELAFKTKKNLYQFNTAAVCNNNNNGEVNEFSKYFTVICFGDKLILKRTNVEYKGSAKDLTGWISYRAYGPGMVKCLYKTEKITVTLVN